MATPQLENGYTRIANEIMEALARIRIPGEAYQVLNVVLRKTYGFNKKEDPIALSQFCLATGLNKPHVCQALSKLKAMNLITEKGNGSPNIYSLNKDFDTWKALPKKVTLPKKVKIVTEKGKTSLPKKVHTKENTTKENITKERGSSLFEDLWNKYPNKDGKKAAERYFNSSVKTEEDCLDITGALKNYLASERVQKGFIKNGSTWFNNWKDWTNANSVKPPEISEKDDVVKKIQAYEKKEGRSDG